ncbi:hypothetical protein GCM10011389_41090 [Pontibacillus salipaludis]|uniref:Uncharacterized protein n=1 Tax=Pontibacillus salipaludis TaxID=1697394 RepID=A0ABQ1QJ66_9BACI|nr:hypothetical protein GCM10011389_41090 [Pontibacillus salipaludis]
MVLEIARLLREKEVDETPQGDFPEEARQLARGKRVISRTTLRSIEAKGNDLYLLHNKVISAPNLPYKGAYEED